VEAELRRAYNAAFGPELYERYARRLREELGPIPFRLAETPLFLPAEVRDRLEQATVEILGRLAEPSRLARMRAAIPSAWRTPNEDDLPACVQVDFALVRDEAGRLTGRVVELQGFPSLYAFEIVQARVLRELLAELPGLPGDLVPWFGGIDERGAVDWLRRVVVADEDPAHVVLLDLDPPRQKTVPDFVATRALLGVESVCPTSLVREGRRLFRVVDGRRVPVRRIFHRVVFDELERTGAKLPYAYGDDLDVTFVPHPNWYWTWSKYSLPLLDHPAVPPARLLSELDAVPDDLERWVLKPLFSFAGAGVKVDPTRADVLAVPASQRGGWVLQRKIAYARDLRMPTGEGVAAELRVMCLRAPGEAAPRPAWNLVRLSRGSMMGVDQNRGDVTWVGSSIGLWPSR
jgi:hypothetical protein